MEQKTGDRALHRLADDPVLVFGPKALISVGLNGLPLSTRHRDAVMKLYASNFFNVWSAEENPLDRGNMDISDDPDVHNISYLGQQFVVDIEKMYCEPVFNINGVASGVRFMREDEWSYRQFGAVLPVESLLCGGGDGKRKDREGEGEGELQTCIVTEMSSGKCQRKVVVTVPRGILL